MGAGSAGCTVGTVHTAIRQQQRVEDHFRLVEERPLCLLAVDSGLVAAFDSRARIVDGLDAKVVVVILECWVGEIIAPVNQGNDNALARIGLWQVGTAASSTSSTCEAARE